MISRRLYSLASHSSPAKSGKMVKVVVGMMGSSVLGGSDATTDINKTKDFLSVVKSHNIKELDTARVYAGGKSEEALGALSAYKDFAISTKAPAFSPHSLAKEKIIDNCNKSLKALKQEKVDIYYIHGPDRDTPLEEQCDAIGQLHKEGKFERFGVSNISPEEVQTIYDVCKRKGYCLPKVYQGAMNPIHRSAETGLLPLLRKLDMNFYVFSPLAGGLFAKKIEDIQNPAPGSRYDAMKVFGDIYLNEATVKAFASLSEQCGKHQITMLEATMRWFMHHTTLEAGDAIILGASSPNQIDASLSSCEKGPLPEVMVKEFQDMWDTTKSNAPTFHI